MIAVGGIGALSMITNRPELASASTLVQFVAAGVSGGEGAKRKMLGVLAGTAGAYLASKGIDNSAFDHNVANVLDSAVNNIDTLSKVGSLGMQVAATKIGNK